MRADVLYILCFEVFLARNVATTYSLGSFKWSLSMIIAAIDKCLASSGPKQ